MLKLSINSVLLSTVVASLSGVAFAADVSLFSGGFKKNSQKIDGKSVGDASSLSAGGRYHEDIDTTMAWFADGGLAFQSYSAGSGLSAPDNAVGIKLGGGVRHYFKPFGAAVVPYAAGSTHVFTSKGVDWRTSGYEETSTNGLDYGAALGIRAGFDSHFFVEIEVPLFESVLFGVTKKTSVNEVAGVKTESKTETTKNELWVGTFGSVMDAKIAVGYKF